MLGGVAIDFAWHEDGQYVGRTSRQKVLSTGVVMTMIV